MTRKEDGFSTFPIRRNIQYAKKKNEDSVALKNLGVLNIASHSASKV